MIGRRSFLGFALVSWPLASKVGIAGEQSLEMFKVLPLPAPPPSSIEWLNGLGVPYTGEGRIGRYRAPLVEDVLLEAIRTCGIQKPRAFTLSLQGCTDYVALVEGERRYSGYDTRPEAGQLGYVGEELVMMTPGHQLTIEVHFGIPDGFLTIR